MTISINCSVLKPVECSFDISDAELDVMVEQGIDVNDEYAVADFYRKNLGKKFGDVSFQDVWQIADYHEHTSWEAEIDEWWPEGEAPEKYWLEEVEQPDPNQLVLA